MSPAELALAVRPRVHRAVGWLFSSEQTSRRRFCPDLLADRPIRILSYNLAYVPVILLAVGLPALAGRAHRRFLGRPDAGRLAARRVTEAT